MQTHVHRRRRNTDNDGRLPRGQPLPGDQQEHLTVSNRKSVECRSKRLAKLILMRCRIKVAGESVREALATF